MFKWQGEKIEDVINDIAYNIGGVDSFYEDGKNVANTIVDKFNLNSDSVIIDYGCGVGRVSRYLSQHVKKVYAIDSSDSYIEMAKKECEGFDNIEFIKLDKSVFRSDLIHEEIDLVFFNKVAQHIDKPLLWVSLKEISKILKPEGCIELHLSLFDINSIVFNNMYETVERAAYHAGHDYMQHEFYFIDEIKYRIHISNLEIKNKVRMDNEIFLILGRKKYE